ncbi:acyl-CoA dehydrogenase family protein [Streptomyces sp. NPDC001292]|uniref:acyl-CoA dehydrogenase family protein n=1 Tax=Streptomyces sp. NPDC001292 TaxID=3364558 RepID=UPI00367EF789
MDLTPSARSAELRRQLIEFMDQWVYPAEATFDDQWRETGKYPSVMEELKTRARSAGLWNLFHPHPDEGAGLTNLDYAPLAEIMGRSLIAPEALNCSAPDTGNMELLSMFGTPEQKARWLRPLLDGTVRSAFAMTEPDVASSDATNIATRITRAGDEYVVHGRKWWVTGAGHPACAFFIVMGKTDPSAARHRQQSQIIVPADAKGVRIVRPLPLLGYWAPETHCEVEFDDVRVPAANLIGAPGDGFAISQARLGPGRIHHCMRSVGAAERALELLCRRALARETFGKPLAARANIRDWIAEARLEIDMLRLLALRAAWLMDTIGNKAAAVEISEIKIAAPMIAGRIIDRAMQVHEAAGMSDDHPLARHYAVQRALRFADGPDEVHKMALARGELRKYATVT